MQSRSHIAYGNAGFDKVNLSANILYFGNVGIPPLQSHIVNLFWQLSEIVDDSNKNKAFFVLGKPFFPSETESRH